MTRDHILVNRVSWDEDAPSWVERGREAWAREEPFWGRGNPESELRLLQDVSGLDAVELGCGTAYVSAWLKRRGARVVGLDNSSKQLATGSPLVMLCYPTDEDEAPADTRLHRNYFGMHRFEWHRAEGEIDAIEFRLGHGDMIRLLRSCGFEIVDLIEIQSTANADAWPPDIPLEWARRWPSAEAWKVRKAG